MRLVGRASIWSSAACFLAVTLVTVTIASETASLGGDRKWKSPTVRLSVSASLLSESSRIKPGSDIMDAVRGATSAWSEVADVAFTVSSAATENISSAKGQGDGVNLVTIAANPDNIALFPEMERSAPAFTRLFFDRSGAIKEADIVLNPYLEFSTDGTVGTFDLRSVLTHEFGHVLGLDHSPAMAATMYRRIGPNTSSQTLGILGRTLSSVDVSSVRDKYGPARSIPSGECCVSLFGLSKQKPGPGTSLWVEESTSGRLVAAGRVDAARYSIGGFDAGRYRVIVQGKKPYAAVQLADRTLDLPVEIRSIEPFSSRVGHDVAFIGIAGELGQLPVELRRGTVEQVFVGGSGLDPRSVKFGFNGNSLTVVPGSVIAIAPGDQRSMVALSVDVADHTPAGAFSLYVEAADGSRRYLVGSVFVR